MIFFFKSRSTYIYIPHKSSPPPPSSSWASSNLPLHGAPVRGTQMGTLLALDDQSEEGWVGLWSLEPKCQNSVTRMSSGRESTHSSDLACIKQLLVRVLTISGCGYVSCQKVKILQIRLTQSREEL